MHTIIGVDTVVGAMHLRCARLSTTTCDELGGCNFVFNGSHLTHIYNLPTIVCTGIRSICLPIEVSQLRLQSVLLLLVLQMDM